MAGNQQATVIARYNYTATDKSELTIRKSERLTLLDDSQHWWRVENTLGQQGYVPSNYMRRPRQGLFSSLKIGFGKRKSSSSNERGPQPLQRLEQQNQQNQLQQQQQLPILPQTGMPAEINNSEGQFDARLLTSALEFTTPSGPPEHLLGPVDSADTALGDIGNNLEQVVAYFNYRAEQEDELSLARGDQILVCERSSDGWWRGRRLADNREGWFPSNYVRPIDSDGQQSLELQQKQGDQQQQPEQLEPLLVAVGAFPFDANNSEELSFVVGQQLEVLSEPSDDPDWWLARDGSGKCGLVPKNHLRPLQMSQPTVPPTAVPVAGAAAAVGNADAPAAVASVQAAVDNEDDVDDDARQQFVIGHQLANLPYFWGSISRAQADSLLLDYAEAGDFLIRVGESNPDDLTLTMRAKAKNRNFKIKQLHDANGATRYNIGQKYFDILDELIHHYKQHPIYKSQDERCYLIRAFSHSLQQSSHC